MVLEVLTALGMARRSVLRPRLRAWGPVSSAPGLFVAGLMALLVAVGAPGAGRAHELSPAICDLVDEGQAVALTCTMNAEAVLAGIDMSAHDNTTDAPEAARYDALRALPAPELEARFRAAWPTIAPMIHLVALGPKGAELGELALELAGVEVELGVPPEFARDTVVHMRAALPAGAEAVRFGWAPFLGKVVIRQIGVEDPYTAFLDLGQTSDPIRLTGGGAQRGWSAFAQYIPVGYKHILPMGLDHILFVLGLFFLSTSWRALLWQVSAFTVAHTLTLALAALGYIKAPGAVVEPLIAASITFVAVENIFTSKLHRWRPLVVFGFGLLHGLGFASVLTEWGLPEGAFVPALIGFNIGVELGQLTVLAVAWFTLEFWFGNKPWYRRVIAIPASAAIAVIGAWWVIERTLL